MTKTSAVQRFGTPVNVSTANSKGGATGELAAGDHVHGIANSAVGTNQIADSAVTSAKIADGAIVNADINASAAIAYSKLALTGSIVNADISASADIAMTKLRPYEFFAYLSGTQANQTGDGTAYTVAFDGERYDPDAVFASNTFTAPVTGKYHFDVCISLTGVGAAHTQAYAYFAPSAGNQVRFDRKNAANIRDSANICHLNGSCDIDLSASATVTVVVIVANGTKVVGVEGSGTVALTYWNGHQVQ